MLTGGALCFPAEFYSEAILLSLLGCLDLLWWQSALQTGLLAVIQPMHTALLGITWGESSGTGLGGTFRWVDPSTSCLPKLQAWMGT